MCGRYSLTTPPEAMEQLFALDDGATPNFAARYNIAPSQKAPVVRRDPANGARRLALLDWGLVPAWSSGPDARFSMINARAETVSEKPAFRAAFRRRRCLVPADGFFEWRAEAGGKQPYYFRRTDSAPLAFAGLWEHWRGSGGELLETYAIIVTAANAEISAIHDRMPVMLDRADYDSWLANEDDGATARALIESAAAPALTIHPVDRRVNSPRNDDPACIAPHSIPNEKPIGQLFPHKTNRF